MAKHRSIAMDAAKALARAERSGSAERDLASRSVRRRSDGAIDIAYYEGRMRRLRARWMRMWLRRFVGRIGESWRRRLAAAELYTLDEHALRDMGITRGDIPAIASGAYVRDESRRPRGGCIGDAKKAQGN